MNLLKLLFCNRKNDLENKQKAENKSYPDCYRAWIKAVMGIDASNWEALETTSPMIYKADSIVDFHNCSGIAASFVVNSEAVDLLVKLYQKQEAEGHPFREDTAFHLLFSTGNTTASLYPVNKCKRG